MAYINVDEVYILDNTGLQVDMATDIPFVDAGFTDAQKEQARKNIAAGGTNPNLLDNSWFTVNSRNISSGSGSAANTYLVDRWQYSYGSGGTSWAWDANGITFAPNNLSSHAILQQKVSFLDEIDGKYITASIMLQNGTIYTGTVLYNKTVEYAPINTSIAEGVTFRFYIRPVGIIALDVYYGSVSLRAVKLELGSFSTLANDTTPDYGEELTRCIYSTADPTDTYANNGFGRTNPNLLDNPWFTVNQRSASNITGSSGGTPSVDRWLLFGSGSTTDLTVTSNGVSVHSASSGFAQRMPSDLADYLDGKTVTLSVMDTSGEVASGSLVYDKTTLKNTGSLTIGSYTCALYAGKSGSNQIFSITTGANTIPLRAVKLELGSVSTLANDAPPNYAEELAKCRYYFHRLNASSAVNILTGATTSTTSATFVLPHEMAVNTGSITRTGTITVNGQSVTAASQTQTSAGVTITVTASSLTAYNGAVLNLASSAYIDISHDL